MPPNKYWYCCLQMYTYFSAFLSSAYLLIAMTFERFYSIIKPHKASSFNTVKKARVIIVCIFFTFFTYSIPFLFIGGFNGVSCTVNRYASSTVLGEFFQWLTELVIFIFPFTSLLTMNSVIIHTLRKRSKENISQGQGQILKTKQPEVQVMVTLLLVTFAFLILNIPVRSLAYYLNFSSGDTPYYYAGLYLFYQIGVSCYYGNHGINFFLYVMSGQKFRADLRSLFQRNST